MKTRVSIVGQILESETPGTHLGRGAAVVWSCLWFESPISSIKQIRSKKQLSWCTTPSSWSKCMYSIKEAKTNSLILYMYFDRELGAVHHRSCSPQLLWLLRQTSTGNELRSTKGQCPDLSYICQRLRLMRINICLILCAEMHLKARVKVQMQDSVVQ